MTDPKPFGAPETIGALSAWWRGLEEDRGGRAQLRRCRDSMEVAFCPAFHRLRIMLRPWGPYKDESLAAAAGITSHVKVNLAGEPLAVRMGRPPSGQSTPPVSGLRFRRLLKIEDRRELYAMLIRIMALLDKQADVGELARIIYFWGPGIKKQLAYGYYENAPDNKDLKKP